MTSDPYTPSEAEKEMLDGMFDPYSAPPEHP